MLAQILMQREISSLLGLSGCFSRFAEEEPRWRTTTLMLNGSSLTGGLRLVNGREWDFSMIASQFTALHKFYVSV